MDLPVKYEDTTPAFWEAIKRSRLRQLRQSSAFTHLPSLPSVKPCYISALPDELFVEILGYFRPDRWCIKANTEEYSAHGQSLVIPLVCRRWRQIFTPILYGICTLNFDTFGRLKFRATSRLILTLQSQGFTKYIKATYIHILGITLDNGPIYQAADIVRCFHQLRSAHIYAESDEAWPIVEAIGKLPLVEELALWSPSKRTVLSCLNLPNLKKLFLKHFGIPTKGTESPHAPDRYSSPRMISQGIDLALGREANRNKITKLELNNPFCPLDFACVIVQQSARLTSLTIDLCVYRHQFRSQFEASGSIQRLLDIHSDTLQHITVDMGHPRHVPGIPSFAHFYKLETLKLFGHSVIGTEETSSMAEKLRAPLLRHLRIQRLLGYDDPDPFADAQVHWLDEMFAFLQAESPSFTARNQLQSLFIDFGPELDQLKGPSSPQEHIEKAMKALAERGVKMTHNPCIREEECFRTGQSMSLYTYRYRSADGQPQ